MYGPFQPISLCNMECKIIAKILVHCLRPLLPQINSAPQAAFSQGRRNSCNNVLAKELVHIMAQPQRQRPIAAIKLDVTKAYGNLQWPFINPTLQAFGFHHVFVCYDVHSL